MASAQWALTVWVVTLLASMVPGWHVLSGSVDTPWRFLLAYGALWLVLLAGHVAWLAPWVARVPPTPGALPVAERHCVLARETSLVRGDKPMNADETQMRQGIQPRDGTHPDVFIVHDASLTVTPPSETARRALALRITGDRVEVGQRGAAAGPAVLPHLLAELVTQSGWMWQGVFSSGRRAAADRRGTFQGNA